MPRPKRTGADVEPQLDLGPLNRLVGFHLREAQIAVFRDFAATVGPLEVSPVIFAVLVLIDGNPGAKQTALARAVRLDRSSMVSVLDNLERRELVVRQAVANDRRSNALQLTPAGTELLRKARRLVASHEKRLARGLSTAEKAQLVALLNRVFPESR
jgi:DNA-binding MarR family transcriptional regulator